MSTRIVTTLALAALFPGSAAAATFSATTSLAPGQDTPAKAAPVQFRVTFGAAIDPASLIASDFSVDGSSSPKTVLTITPVGAGNTTFDVRVTSSGNGLIRFSLPAGRVVGANPADTNSASNQTNVQLNDQTPPTAPDAGGITVTTDPTTGVTTVTGGSGAVEGYSTVTVQNADGSTLCTAGAASDGSFSCAGTATGGSVSIFVTDAVGNVSSAITETVPDVVPPPPPAPGLITVTPDVTNGPVTVTGSAGAVEGGSTVTVIDSTGITVCSTAAAADGSFACSGTTHSGSVTVAATDATGNTSTTTAETFAFDATPPPAVDPAKVTIVAVGEGAAVVVTGGAGAADPGTTVSAVDATGTTICIATVASDGSFTCTGDAADGKVTLVVRDTAGNAADATPSVAPATARLRVRQRPFRPTQTLRRGARVRFLLVVRSTGTSSARDVTIRYRVPKGLRFVRVGITRGKIKTTFDRRTRMVVIRLGAIKVGGRRELRVITRMTSRTRAGVLRTTAIASASNASRVAARARVRFRV